MILFSYALVLINTRIIVGYLVDKFDPFIIRQDASLLDQLGVGVVATDHVEGFFY